MDLSDTFRGSLEKLNRWGRALEVFPGWHLDEEDVRCYLVAAAARRISSRAAYLHDHLASLRCGEAPIPPVHRLDAIGSSRDE